VFRGTCGDYRVLSTFAHGLRVPWAPGIPLRPRLEGSAAPSVFMGGCFDAQLGRSARRAYGLASRSINVIARSTCDEAIQSSLVALDCFAALAMTVVEQTRHMFNHDHPFDRLEGALN
jgi:hypothetical protein